MDSNIDINILNSEKTQRNSQRNSAILKDVYTTFLSVVHSDWLRGYEVSIAVSHADVWGSIPGLAYFFNIFLIQKNWSDSNFKGMTSLQNSNAHLSEKNSSFIQLGLAAKQSRFFGSKYPHIWTSINIWYIFLNFQCFWVKFDKNCQKTKLKNLLCGLKNTNFPSGFEPQTHLTWNFESAALPTELLGLVRFVVKNWASYYQKNSA